MILPTLRSAAPLGRSLATRAELGGLHRFAAPFCGKTTRSGDLPRWPTVRPLVRKLNLSASVRIYPAVPSKCQQRAFLGNLIALWPHSG